MRLIAEVGVNRGTLRSRCDGSMWVLPRADDTAPFRAAVYSPADSKAADAMRSFSMR
jgi:hypothetical protein